MTHYIIIKTGCEGIDSLLWLTESREEAVKKKQEFIEAGIKEEKRLFKDNPKTLARILEDYADYYCIQKWHGGKFKCVCRKLGVPPSKLMLR